MFEGMTIAEVMGEIRRARREAEEAEARFFVVLWHVEQERPDVWGAAGATFDMFLQTHHCCQPARYREFVAGMDKTSEADVVAIGVDAARVAAKMNPEAVPAFVAQCKDFAEVNGVKPSEQTARDYAKRLQQPEPRPVAQANELRTLRAENAELRAKLKLAERRIADLERENEDLKLGRPAPRKPAKKAARATA